MGAWIEIKVLDPDLPEVEVAPLVGAWIEICIPRCSTYSAQSLPSWERGLKWYDSHRNCGCSRSLPSWERGLKCYFFGLVPVQYLVAPLVGAWIEM